jgi:hypothetical protein
MQTTISFDRKGYAFWRLIWIDRQMVENVTVAPIYKRRAQLHHGDRLILFPISAYISRAFLLDWINAEDLNP